MVSDSLARSMRCGGGRAVVDQRQLHVVQRAGAGQQVEGLEDEADFLVADAGQLVVIQFADQLTVEPVVALGRRIEAADQVHERGLAGARRAHDGHVFVVLDAQGDAAQGLHLLLRAHVVGAPQILDDDHVACGPVEPAACRPRSSMLSRAIRISSFALLLKVRLPFEGWPNCADVPAF